jgi:hypothetical protein
MDRHLKHDNGSYHVSGVCPCIFLLYTHNPINIHFNLAKERHSRAVTVLTPEVLARVDEPFGAHQQTIRPSAGWF